MIEIKCPNGHRLNVPAEFIGKQIRCAACQETFTVPDQASAPPQVNTGAASADPVPPPPEDTGFDPDLILR